MQSMMTRQDGKLFTTLLKGDQLRCHEGDQLRHILVGKSPGTTHKKAKGKLPTRSQPSRTKSTSSATALHIASTKPRTTHHLVVDTGASHVLLRQQNMDLLTSIQMSDSGQPPFAILRAANGQNLNSIGRGMLAIRIITIVAYIFRDARNCPIR
jgi:hypothetical protein